ncbi:hypothetical protein [Plantactinospora sp. GCM10030261]|uniref:phosphorylase family protein n=1 Tax=Plantactinospora sp. GCM10030261 TaxID=3273420 RepID=UPI0036138980
MTGPVGDLRPDAPAGLIVYAAMRTEARRLRRGLPDGPPVRRTGMGLAAATRSAARFGGGSAPVAAAGVGGGLTARLSPGDLVVATAIRGPDGTVLDCPSAPLLAAALRRRGGRVHLGPVLTTRRLVRDPGHRDRLASTGALVVDTESAAWLAATTGPRVCVRAVADVPPYPLLRPATLVRLRAALRALDPVGPALRDWAAATTVRQVLLGGPDPALAATGADVWLLPGPPDSPSRPAATGWAGPPAYRVCDPAGLDPRWLAGARVVGVAAGPTTRPGLVAGVLAALCGLGAKEVRPDPTVPSTLPLEVTTP